MTIVQPLLYIVIAHWALISALNVRVAVSRSVSQWNVMTITSCMYTHMRCFNFRRQLFGHSIIPDDHSWCAGSNAGSLYLLQMKMTDQIARLEMRELEIDRTVHYTIQYTIHGALVKYFRRARNE